MSDETSIAAQRDLEKAEWLRMRDALSVEAIRDYLLRFPAGWYAELAQAHLDRLQQPKLVLQPGPDGIRRLPAGEPRYRAGDVFVWQRYEDYHGKPKLSPVTQQVIEADDQLVFFSNGQVVQQDGVYLGDTIEQIEPGYVKYPNDIALGKKWKTDYEFIRSNKKTGDASISFRVTSLERVSVPAGTFLAFKIVGNGFDSRGQSLYREHWIDPKTMLPVKEVWRTRTYSGYTYGAAVNEVRELASITRGVGATRLPAPSREPTPWPDYMSKLQPGVSLSINPAALSHDVTIAPPDPSLPSATAAFVGKWSGWACREKVCGTKLAVEQIGAEGASIVYVLTDRFRTAKPIRLDAKFIDGELRAAVPGGQIAYRLRDPSHLDFVFRTGQRLIAGVLTKDE